MEAGAYFGYIKMKVIVSRSAGLENPGSYFTNTSTL